MRWSNDVEKPTLDQLNELGRRKIASFCALKKTSHLQYTAQKEYLQCSAKHELV